MKAPQVSRRFHNALLSMGVWSVFVNAFKAYAARVKPSRVITLDGIGDGPRRDYLTRWHLIPRNKWFNLYLHKFVHGDDERALHDHPWASASLILEGRYIERTSNWMPETAYAIDEAGINAHVAEMHLCFNPDDGRTYVEGSVGENRLRWPGQHVFDYTQGFEAGDFRKLPPEHMHLIELYGDNNEPCWTLFMTGSIVRRWGFACGGDAGWRDFKEYLQPHPKYPNATLGCD